MSQLVTVPFHGDTLFAVRDGDAVHVVIKPICDALGVDWKAQRNRIDRSAVLAKGRVVMTLPSPGGPQEQVCLRLDLVNGWLFGIDARRVKPEARDRVLAYQTECCAVLFRRFFGAPGERDGHHGHTSPAGPVREESISVRHGLVKEARQIFGTRAAGSLWFALGLPVVPEMRDGGRQGAFGFTYTAVPATPERSA